MHRASWPRCVNSLRVRRAARRWLGRRSCHKEAGYLRSLRAARERVKDVLEGPDSDIDRIIRSVRENAGQLSNKLKKTYAQLADPHIGDAVAAAINAAFAQH